MDKLNVRKTAMTTVLIAVSSLILAAGGISQHGNPTSFMSRSAISRLKQPGVPEATWGKQGQPEWESIDEGHRLYRSGNKSAAIRHWHGLWCKYKHSRIDVACAALENVAKGYWDRHQYRDAIITFNQLVSNIEGRDSNALYSVCLALSDLHVELSNIPESLHFAEMAKVKQAEMFYLCGSAAQMDEMIIQHRIKQLQQAGQRQAAVFLSDPAIRNVGILSVK